jgi:vacuolar-type H+-ATPase subunit C/Vma6
MAYTYLVGVIRSIEDKLLTKVQIEKLSKTSRHGFLKTLRGFGYGAKDIGKTLEEILNDEMSGLKALFDENTPNEKETNLLFLPLDALLIKYWYKQKLFGDISASGLDVPSILKSSVVKKAILEANYEELPKEFIPLFVELNKTLTVSINPRSLSNIIDQAIYGFMFKSINLLTSSGLVTYLKQKVDFTNIMSLLRGRALKWTIEDTNGVLIKGGSIPLLTLMESFKKTGESFVLTFKPFYNELLLSPLKLFQKTRDWSALEKSLDMIILEEVKTHAFDSFEIGPVLYYFLLKKEEIVSIRNAYSQCVFEESEGR